MRKQGTATGEQQGGEQGFMLLGLIVAIAIILFVLGEAASKTAFTLRREREVESARRADQYVRAIRRFYLKNHSYPGSLDQLQKTNNIRYLRQLYFDPLTGKQDYRLIVVGQNKTTVKGFFGEPLAGLSSTGPGGSMGGSTDASGGTAGTATAGANGAATAAGATSPGGSTGLSGPASTFGASGTAGGLGSTGGLGSPGTPGSSSQEPGSQTGGGPGSSLGPIMGVGSSATGNSILSVNGETTYQTWEFLYDPRIEKLKAAAALNAGASSTGAGAGQTSNPFGPSGTTGATTPTTTTGAGASGGATPNGATPGTGP